MCVWYVRILTFDFSLKYVFHFFSRYLVVGSRYDFFFGFNNMRRNTCRSYFVKYQAKTWKQPCVAFRGECNAAVRQIASLNDSHGYTIVNCVWPHYNSISQLAHVYVKNSQLTQADDVFIFTYVRQITIYVLCIYSQIISILTGSSEVLCRVCMLQIQPRQHAIEHAVCVAPIPQRELDHTDQGYICPGRASSCGGNR